MNEPTDDELEELFDAASFHYDFSQFDAEEKADILAAMRLAMEKARKEERDACEYACFKPATLGNKDRKNMQQACVSAIRSRNKTGEKDNGGFNSGDLMAAMMRDGVGS